MLQRIQTLFILGAILVNLVSLFIPVWNYSAGETTEMVSGIAIVAEGLSAENVSTQDFTANPFHIAFFAANILIAIFLVVTIFQYNNRPKQMAWVQIGVIMLLVEIVILVLLTSRGPYLIDEAGKGGMASIGFALPVVAVILLWIGRRKIKADDELVKSVDRIR